MAFLDKLKQFKFRGDLPEDVTQSLQKWLGRQLKVMSGKTVTVTDIAPSRIKPSRFVINATEEIVALDFFKQMNGDKSITQAQIDAFDAMELDIERAPKRLEPKSLIEVQ